jgi:hypothetical protein
LAKKSHSSSSHNNGKEKDEKKGERIKAEGRGRKAEG